MATKRMFQNDIVGLDAFLNAINNSNIIFPSWNEM